MEASGRRDMAFDVITVGSATRDVYVKSAAFDVHGAVESPTGLEACLPLGSKIELKEIFFDTGGGATNSAVTFSKLGNLKVATISRVGKDVGGSEVIRTLKEKGARIVI